MCARLLAERRRRLLSVALCASACASACLTHREKTVSSSSPALWVEPVRPPVRYSYTVRGRVSDATGGKLRLAHARILDLTWYTAAETQVGADGRFVLSKSDVRGSVAWLELTAVDHGQTRILIAPEPLDVDILLGTYPPAPPAAAPSFVLRVGKKTLPPEPMTPLGDGRYFIDVDNPDGTITYELGNVTETHTVNGTLADRYEYDGGGDYASILTRNEATVRIIYDPALRARLGVPSRVRFNDSASASADLAEVSELTLPHFALVTVAPWTTSADPSASDADSSASRYRPAAQAANSESPAERRAALVVALNSMLTDAPPNATGTQASHEGDHDPKASLARRALTEIDPTDLVWALDPDAFREAIELCGGEDRNAAYVSHFVNSQPAPEPVACYLASEISANQNNPGKLRRLRHFLASDRFASTSFAEQARAGYAARAALFRGKPLPDFTVTSLDGRGQYSPLALRGRVYLIEVWATWCGPCVAGMPALHAAFAKYGQNTRHRPLHILSISLDDSPDDVVAFRKSQWPMPWQHAKATRTEEMRLTSLFGGAIPFYALVDEQGNVIASSPQLHPGDLPMILDRMGN